jgi:hypothetical protein
LILTGRQGAIDTLERERMLKRQRYPFRARDHGDVLEVAAQSLGVYVLTRQEKRGLFRPRLAMRAPTKKSLSPNRLRHYPSGQRARFARRLIQILRR